MSWANAVWWLLYAFAAIAVQAVLPGVDFLLPGFIVALQERRLFQIAFVGTAFLLMQEGMGSMAFGGILLWYAVASVLYWIACSLFQGGSFLFIFLLSCILSGVRYVLFGTLASLQNIPWEPASLLDECFFQAVLTPCIWWAATSLRGDLSREAGE